MLKIKQLPRRQRVRKTMLFISLLLFPVTLYYFSPVIILESAAQGIINASFIVFGLLFITSLVAGRLWCGWICPAGGLQEFGSPINNKPAPGSKLDWIKWAVWLPWIGLIALLAIRAGGYHSVDPLYHLERGLTLAQPSTSGGPPWYVIYYIIILVFAGLAVVCGRRASCHAICWMAPFMILGIKIRSLLKGPALELQAEPETCTGCLLCTRECPMSLNVHHMVQSGNMTANECILCGTCVDGCPQQVIRFSFSTARQAQRSSHVMALLADLFGFGAK